MKDTSIPAILEIAPDSGRNEAFDTVGAARYLGCTAGYLKKLRQTGEGPVYHRLFKRKGIMYRKDDMDLWQSHRRFSSTSEYPEALR